MWLLAITYGIQLFPSGKDWSSRTVGYYFFLSADHCKRWSLSICFCIQMEALHFRNRCLLAKTIDISHLFALYILDICKKKKLIRAAIFCSNKGSRTLHLPRWNAIVECSTSFYYNSNKLSLLIKIMCFFFFSFSRNIRYRPASEAVLTRFMSIL